MTDRRDATCVQRWPDCESGLYDPRCCRFPKSCSCETTSPPATNTGRGKITYPTPKVPR